MKNDDEQSSLMLAVIGIIPVIWFALLVAPYLSSGLMGILDGVSEAMNHPFSIQLCGDSVKTVLIFLLSYGMGIGIYISTKKHYRRGEEHGSAKWGNVKKINRRYKEKRFTKNKLLTMHVQISYNMRKHLRNVLTVVIGGSGSGKTRFFAKPNLMQANTSFVVLDPKGENLRDTGYLLEEKGYEVIGTTLELFVGSSCCNINTYIDAKNVCNQIGVPHFTYNCKEEFKNYVINDFINCYANCKTPNPCIECNKYMKFGIMWEKAKELGCNYIATGHYAKIEYSEKYKQYVLKKSNAGKKDQSYVLYNLPRQMTDKVLFPLGDFENKEQIRKIAEEHNLQVARKPDSEDICFIPEGDYKKFLEANSDLKAKVGNIVNTEGKILGKHEGLYKYTIGQRKGLGISNEVPLFVKGFNPEKNELIVGEETEIFSKEAIANEINLILMDEITRPMDVKAKIRYAAKEAECTIYPEEEGKIRVVFNQPQRAITPGQSVVFYIDDIVLGGGKICDL